MFATLRQFPTLWAGSRTRPPGGTVCVMMAAVLIGKPSPDHHRRRVTTAAAHNGRRGLPQASRWHGYANFLGHDERDHAQ